MSRRLTVATGMALATVLLSSCGGPDDAAGEPGADQQSEGFTAPGTTLSSGQTASLPFNGGKAMMDLTVTGVERGTSADLASIGFDEAAQRTPYYVRVEATLVSGDSGDYYFPTADLTATAGETAIPNLAYAGDFPACENANFQGRVAPGSTITACIPFLVTKGEPAIDTVGFADGEQYQAVDQTQVVWSELSPDS